MARHIAGTAALLLAAMVSPAMAADRWTGASAAQDGGSCTMITFDITIDGAAISGSATSPGRSGDVRWQARGRRDGTSISFDMTQGSANDARMQRTRWIGRITGDQMEITQNEQSVSCRRPRSAVLRRS